MKEPEMMDLMLNLMSSKKYISDLSDGELLELYRCKSLTRAVFCAVEQEVLRRICRKDAK